MTSKHNSVENKNTKTQTVLVAGTFDFFHKGHQKFLTDALALGEKLLVIVARDSSVKKIKGFFPTHSQAERIAEIQKFSEENFLDISVFLGEEKDFLALPKKLNPDIFALGYDQNPPEKFLDIFSHKKIVRMDAFFPEKFKSSFFRG